MAYLPTDYAEILPLHTWVYMCLVPGWSRHEELGVVKPTLRDGQSSTLA